MLIVGSMYILPLAISNINGVAAWCNNSMFNLLNRGVIWSVFMRSNGMRILNCFHALACFVFLMRQFFPLTNLLITDNYSDSIKTCSGFRFNIASRAIVGVGCSCDGHVSLWNLFSLSSINLLKLFFYIFGTSPFFAFVLVREEQ